MFKGMKHGSNGTTRHFSNDFVIAIHLLKKELFDEWSGVREQKVRLERGWESRLGQCKIRMRSEFESG